MRNIGLPLHGQLRFVAGYHLRLCSGLFQAWKQTLDSRLLRKLDVKIVCRQSTFSFSFPVSLMNTNHTNTLSRNWWQCANKMSIKQQGNERQNNTELYNVIRVLIHLVGCLQFSYSVYYDWNYVVIPPSASRMGSGYGGKLKFLTNWDAVSLL